jgi:alanine dehydrogenase
MLIGVPREIKSDEYRVGLTPASVRELVAHGHQVLVERDAGAGINTADSVYLAAGASIAGSPEEIFARAEMIVKVKEPQAKERKQLRHGQILFTYLHLAPDPEQARDLVASGAICIAYETVTAPGGGLPLLAPMSEVAGRMSIQAGAHNLEKTQGGMGILLGGVAGVPPAKIVILGAGVVGSNAAQIAVGSGARVVVHALNPPYTAWEAQAMPLLDAGLRIAGQLQALLMLPGNVYNFGDGMPPLLTPDTPEQPTTTKGRQRCAMEAELRARTAAYTTHFGVTPGV